MIGPRIGAGREAEVFAADVDTVVKLYRSGFHGHESEAAALACLDGLGVAPRLIDVTDRHDRRGLVLERLPGVDMLTSLQRRPWRLPDLAQRLATTHVRIHEITAPTALPDLRDLLTQRIHDAPMPSPLRDFALRVLSTLPPGDWLTHGDYHPGNVLVTPDRLGVIDWASAARGTPEADHARTLLLLQWADPLPGTPLLARGLMAAGRSAFARTYARTYRRRTRPPPQQIRSWLTVNVAARMSEGIDAEHAKLLAVLDAARRRDRHRL